MTAEPQAGAPSSGDPGAEARLQERNEWFATTPDPWMELARLQYAGDRTFASTVHQMVLNAEPAQHTAIETRLLGVLAQPGLTDAGRLFVCRMLGLVGSAACVPAVAPLLQDVRTADVARIALDGVPGGVVDEAYRAALPQLGGAAKAGLIGSIAARRDVGAIEVLTAIALDGAETREVRDVAERAVKQLVVLR